MKAGITPQSTISDQISLTQTMKRVYAGGGTVADGALLLTLMLYLFRIDGGEGWRNESHSMVYIRNQA